MRYQVSRALIMGAFAVATPLSAQTPSGPMVRSGIEIQVRRASDTAWTSASTESIVKGMNSCVVVRLDPGHDADGGYMLTSFKAFSGVRVKDATGHWTEISADELTKLQECVPG